MPRDTSNYPDAMKNLSDDVREKVIEIANVLVEQGEDEGTAITIAISQAKETLSAN